MRAYYERGGSAVYLGDTLQTMRAMEAEQFDAVLTDPPFSSGTRKEGSKGLRKSMNRGTEDAEWFGTDSLTTTGFVWLMRECALEWRRLLRPGGHILCFIDWRMMPALSGAIESADLRHVGVLVWDKTYFGMGACFRNQHEIVLHFTKGQGAEPQRRDRGNVLRYKPIRDGLHETEKPVSLLVDLLTTIVPPGGRVLDSYCGSGSTLEAARDCGLEAVGIDNEEIHCATAADRIRTSRAAVMDIRRYEQSSLLDGAA